MFIKKNITLAGKSVFMGIKIDFLTYVFRFRPMGIFESYNK